MRKLLILHSLQELILISLKRMFSPFKWKMNFGHRNSDVPGTFTGRKVEGEQSGTPRIFMTKSKTGKVFDNFFFSGLGE